MIYSNSYLDNESATVAAGAELAQLWKSGGVVFLNGDLGAGKTTLVRGVLQALGYHGRVKSPTYTLVEEYRLDDLTVYHFDLYRLNNPLDLDGIGIRDYLHPGALCLFEWPERGAGVLPAPDWRVDLTVVGEGRQLQLSQSTE